MMRVEGSLRTAPEKAIRMFTIQSVNEALFRVGELWAQNEFLYLLFKDLCRGDLFG